MFAQILWTQFKWTRTMLAVFMVIAFAAPTLAWRIGTAGSYGAPSALALMVGFTPVGPMLMGMAVLAGFLLVAVPWTADAAAKHVYPLSLPLPWSRYVGMRFGAGALTLLLPTLALWLGAIVAVALMQIPPTLHAYPGRLAVRFALAALLAYAFTFLLQALAGRRAPVVVLALLIGAVGVSILFSVSGYGGLLTRVGHFLTDWPGPFAVFANEWKLVDV